MKEEEKRMIELITSIEILVSYNNQMDLLDKIETILNDEQKELFQEIREDTINQKWENAK